MKLLIVGGVAGGASAAARARRLSESAEIVMFERGPDVSFANCGLPYYVGGIIPDRNKLLVTTAERLRQRFRLDVRTGALVEAIDRAQKTVTVRQLATGETYTESYDKLILAPGAAPIRPPLPGVDHPSILTLRNLQDVDRIKAAVDRGAQRVVMVGGGFIGLELVENFVHKGLASTIVEVNDQVMMPFDKELVAPLMASLVEHGVELVLKDLVTGFSTDSADTNHGALIVELRSGRRLPADLVILGVGVRPENQLAVAAGLDVGPRGGIRVNAQLQTSDPEIYAVGDAIEVSDVVIGQPTQVPLAGPANRQGRLAVDHAFGRSVRYRGTQGTAIIGLFGMTAALTGASEKVLKRQGIDYRVIYIHPAHHAGYYPGAEGMTLKVLFEPVQGKLLGAQGVGGAGVDKRIDILATAIFAGLTVYDLEELELAYAPQFGSAKDPINMAGFVAAGWLRGDHPQISWPQWESLCASEAAEPAPSQRPLLIDVRTPTEFAAGAIPGAVNIPVDELRDRLGEIPQDRRVVAYCQVGQRGYLATRILLQSGYQATNLSGGYKTYLLFHPAAASTGNRPAVVSPGSSKSTVAASSR